MNKVILRYGELTLKAPASIGLVILSVICWGVAFCILLPSGAILQGVFRLIDRRR